jgi:hypothetical protein
MVCGMRQRVALVSAAIAAAAVALPSVAQAEPPSNDDFTTATLVSVLPFRVQQDTSAATGANDDPNWCQSFEDDGTVWFSFTPTENAVLRASTAGSDHGTILSVNTGVRGDLHPVPGACSIGTSSAAEVTFSATAGTTYHFMVEGFFVAGGSLSFALDALSPAPNDNFAHAEPLNTLPSTREPDLATASAELDEPTSRCTFDRAPDRSVWYAFTAAEAVSVVAEVDGFLSAVSVYTGTDLAGMREVKCAQGDFGFAVFRAEPGVTYYVRVSGPFSLTQPVPLRLTQAPALQPLFNTAPFEPTIYDQTQFTASAGDPVEQPIAGGEWDFGDGATAPVTATPTLHHYAEDGTYPVRLTVTTEDGRTGSVVTPLTVLTHDVSIAKFATPAKARTGETKPITVQVANTRYRESATTDLYRSSRQGWTLVGTLTLDVPARPDRTVKFPFAYTFTAEDALVGAVTFRAVVRLPFSERDARPMDNEVIAISTTVRPSLTDLRFA